MYASLLEWCTFPVKVHKKQGVTAGGDPKYAPPVEYKGYPVDKVTAITDKYGKQYVSMSCIYFPPEVPVSIADMLSLGEGPPMEIRRIGGFYDGNEGMLSILVVYL